jgi:hypothetical protein
MLLSYVLLVLLIYRFHVLTMSFSILSCHGRFSLWEICFFFHFISIYSLYRERFVVIILNSFTWYIGQIVHSMSLYHPFPIPLEAVTRGFIALFLLRIWRPSTLFFHPHFLHSSPSLKRWNSWVFLTKMIIFIVISYLFKEVSLWYSDTCTQ